MILFSNPVHVKYAIVWKKLLQYNWNTVNTDGLVVQHQAISSNSIHNAFLLVYGLHYSDVIMGTMASQITSLTIVYSTV